jgi:hypothetical protein
MLDFSRRRDIFARAARIEDGPREGGNLMRVMATLALVLALGPTAARAQGSQCMYANQFFSSGSVSCQNGKQFRCRAGSWEPSGLDCADTSADQDQGALNVDPSRAAPAVRQPGVRDPGVRQPGAPVAPVP